MLQCGLLGARSHEVVLFVWSVGEGNLSAGHGCLQLCKGGVASAHRTCELREEQGKDAEAQIWIIKAGYALNIHIRSTHKLVKQQGHTSMPLGNMRLHELSKGMFSLRSRRLPEAGRLPKTAQNANTAENGGKTYHSNPTSKAQHQTHLHRSPVMLSP